MNIHSILVFLHVLGGVGVYVMLGIEAAGLATLRRARSPEEVRAPIALLALPRRIGPTSLLTVLITGIWMSAKWWGMQPWIMCTLVAIVAMAVIGGVVSGRVMRRIGGALSAESGPGLSDSFRSLQSSRALTRSLSLRAGVAVGILALMTMKPGITGSLITLSAATVAGLAGGMRSGGTRRISDEHTLRLKGVQS